MRSFFGELTAALIECVEYVAHWNTPYKDGDTRAERNARFDMEHLTPEQPSVPFQVEHVWDWYWQLSRNRPSGMSGVEPLSWTDIQAWSALTMTQVLPEELDMLLAMDNAFRRKIAEDQEAEKAAEKETRFLSH